jgi:hypothetical protein
MDVLSWLFVIGLAVAAISGVQAFDILVVDFGGGW